ncbi:type I DNA topoisomerase [Apibacter muscae]|uniref:DNA topoisomerase 1 n=1 Tax=Apibacter muscae TaxID=2509004 RepID=A0A563DBJ7_9FLAO|nr:type I DNA topoisomerase [Apibacter muscae]TWP27467.1 type I DNA topoisomerase [Apibacter muscae]TWP28881.1 type I DNA topoisomerase [Apibacter muscae]
MNLVIVESPAKAKTIKKFLGDGFEVESSYGHITDLAKKDMGIDKTTLEPIYQVSSDKKDVVKKLKSLAQKADTIWLASDEDREGEAIAWHLYNELKLKPENTKRIVFHEITQKAIQNAIENPRDIDINLVNAQQARRVLDRLVGFEMSPILWSKVKAGLSAGRVQSVAVRLICERENEIKSFIPVPAYKIQANFINQSQQLVKSKLNIDFEEYPKALNFIQKIKGKEFSVSSIEIKPGKRSPSAPFTTSTLQQEASKLGFSVSRTMMLAQQLYEAGHITYMRTDSVNLSEEAINSAKQIISDKFGKEYLQTRQYVTKNKSAQEAHEAIRPTNFNLQQAGEDDAQKKLYHLIWRRTLASQMSDAKLERTVVDIQTSGMDEKFVARGEVLRFDGFLKLYHIEQDEDTLNEEVEGLLPKLTQGESVTLEFAIAEEKFSRPSARYNEASLVRKLEELGIGRPSTYAPTISTIQKRQYVEVSDLEPKQRNVRKIELKGEEIIETIEVENYGADRRKLIPTDIGLVVNEFLTDHFPNILDYGFTAKVEEDFDSIAGGSENWKEMLTNFYKDFHPHVEEVKENADRATGERLLGQDPVSGKNIYARIGRFGPMVQIGETEDEEKPRFAGLMKGQKINSITLDEALKLFDLPRNLGNYEDKKVEVNTGRFGPYVRHDGKFVSLKPKEGDEVFSITLDRAVELIEAKRESDRNKFIKSFEEEDPMIEILNGRWGPYIKQGKENYKIPKDTDAQKLTLEEVKKLIKGTDTKSKAKAKPKTKTKKTTTTKKKS